MLVKQPNVSVPVGAYGTLLVQATHAKTGNTVTGYSTPTPTLTQTITLTLPGDGLRVCPDLRYCSSPAQPRRCIHSSHYRHLGTVTLTPNPNPNPNPDPDP